MLDRLQRWGVGEIALQASGGAIRTDRALMGGLAPYTKRADNKLGKRM